jgi:hypothetical protein
LDEIRTHCSQLLSTNNTQTIQLDEKSQQYKNVLEQLKLVQTSNNKLQTELKQLKV